jgi:hypothetical protein
MSLGVYNHELPVLDEERPCVPAYATALDVVLKHDEPDTTSAAQWSWPSTRKGPELDLGIVKSTTQGQHFRQSFGCKKVKVAIPC